MTSTNTEGDASSLREGDGLTSQLLVERLRAGSTRPPGRSTTETLSMSLWCLLKKMGKRIDTSQPIHFASLPLVQRPVEGVQIFPWELEAFEGKVALGPSLRLLQAASTSHFYRSRKKRRPCLILAGRQLVRKRRAAGMVCSTNKSVAQRM